MQKEAMRRRFVQSIVFTSHIETVEGSVLNQHCWCLDRNWCRRRNEDWFWHSYICTLICLNLFPTLTFNLGFGFGMSFGYNWFFFNARDVLIYSMHAWDYKICFLNLFSVSCFLVDCPFPTAAAAENKKMLFQIALILLCCNCSEQFNLDLIAF